MITIIKVALYWSQLIKDGEILVQPGFEPATSHSCMISTPEHSPNWANQAVVKWNLLAGVDSICFFFPYIDPTCICLQQANTFKISSTISPIFL